MGYEWDINGYYGMILRDDIILDIPLILEYPIIHDYSTITP